MTIEASTEMVLLLLVGPQKRLLGLRLPQIVNCKLVPRSPVVCRFAEALDLDPVHGRAFVRVLRGDYVVRTLVTERVIDLDSVDGESLGSDLPTARRTVFLQRCLSNPFQHTAGSVAAFHTLGLISDWPVSIICILQHLVKFTRLIEGLLCRLNQDA